VAGKETLGKIETTVVRGTRTATGSTEELYFDNKSGFLVRFTSITRSTLGAVLSIYDYANYKSVDGVKVPSQVAFTFASGKSWTLNFKSITTTEKVDDSIFSPSKVN